MKRLLAAPWWAKATAIMGGLVLVDVAARFAFRPRVVLAPAKGDRLKPPPPAPLEAWEEDAEFGGEVGSDWDEGTLEAEPQGVVIGSGSPDDLCGPVQNPLPEEACVRDPLKDARFAPVVGDVRMGSAGTTGAIWPLTTRHQLRLVTSYRTKDGLRGSWGRELGAKRYTEDGEVRRHAGVDMFAKSGDAVVAPEAGRIVAVLPFHHGTWAVYLRIPGGRVLNLGEVEKYSWREFGIRPGLQVKQGQPVARVGKMSGGNAMLHLEAYDAADALDDDLVDEIRAGQMRWTEDRPPARLLDPSAYLVDAAARTHRREITGT